jgi:hypothetical protein
MITKQFQSTVALFYKASQETFYSTQRAKLFYGFFLGLPAVLIAFYILSGKSLTKSTLFGLPVLVISGICVFYALCFMPTLQYFAVRKYARSNPSINQLQNYTISKKGIRNFGNGFDSTLRWDDIIQVHQSKHFLLLYISNTSAYFIPLNILLPSEIEQIESWSKSKT